ncbi:MULTISPECIES: hypothetical protein [unclassified Streptomyces]|uniref:hypothetical protein n=1 Tax=unclassified Streptomyces TaxID=2593676 RepID=UPI001F227EF3|nr:MULTISPECIES: hypothetical protein [unclassified Streptomyces]
MRFESLRWCECNRLPDDDACTLYLDHAREHSWDVRDPETEALRRSVLTDHAGWLARFTGKPD